MYISVKTTARTLFSSRSKYSTEEVEMRECVMTFETDLLSCLRIARKHNERNLEESDAAEAENK
jgi:hypothetical protein